MQSLEEGDKDGGGKVPVNKPAQGSACTEQTRGKGEVMLPSNTESSSVGSTGEPIFLLDYPERHHTHT
jgi:hypothetical protein